MASFLMSERIYGGWRFIALWIVSSTLGFAIGAGIEWLLFGNINLFIAVSLATISEGWVAGRHEPVWALYSGGGVIGWVLGALVGYQIVGMTPLPLIANLMLVGFVGGIISGILQWFALSVEIKAVGWWWILVSGFSKALVIPGIISGLVLSRFMRDHSPYIEQMNILTPKETTA